MELFNSGLFVTGSIIVLMAWCWIIWELKHAPIEPSKSPFNNKFSSPPGIEKTVHPKKPFPNFNTWAAFIRKQNREINQNK